MSETTYLNFTRLTDSPFSVVNLKSLKSEEVTCTPFQLWVNFKVIFTGAGFTQQSTSSLHEINIKRSTYKWKIKEK